MEDEDVIERIKKLISLAEDNPEPHEAAAAAAAAQRLMAKHRVEKPDTRKRKHEPVIEVKDTETVFEGNPWGVRLAEAIADNFRCLIYLTGEYRKAYGRNKRIRHVVFVGYETDAKAAQMTFARLFQIGLKLADEEVRKARKLHGTTAGVRNSFLVGEGFGGYVGGIRNALEQQSEDLMIVRAPAVDIAFTRITRGFGRGGTGARSTRYDASSAQRGYAAGRNAVRGSRLSGPRALPSGRG